jgi:hypothetical protein
MASLSLGRRFCNHPTLDACDWDTRVTSPKVLPGCAACHLPSPPLRWLLPRPRCHDPDAVGPDAAAIQMPLPPPRWRCLCRCSAVTTAAPTPPLLPHRRCCVPTITFAALTLPPLPCHPCRHCCCPNTAVAAPPCSPALAASLWVGPAGPHKKLSGPGPGPGPRCEGRLLLALALALKGPVRVGPRAGRARPGPRTV